MLETVEKEAEVLPNPGMRFIDTLFAIDVPPEFRKRAQIRVVPPGPDTPTANPHYVFTKEQMLTLQFWINDEGREGQKTNLMLTGPTGSGKTSLIEQLAARIGFGCVKVPCHGELEFEDLIGTRTLNDAGGMMWADGPVIRAMRTGSILLLDEINFLRPEIVGGLNAILDGGSLLISSTSERVHPHPNFRIAATGNAIDGTDAGKYRGTRRQNDSLLDRFLLGIRLDYMPADQERALLQRMYPRLDDQVIEVMMDVTTATRASQKTDDLSVAISTRVLLNGWAREVHRQTSPAKQAEQILPALETTMLFRVPASDRTMISNTVTQVLQRKQLVKQP
ncbi:AAA family ATPase [Burkholderia anthina]|uniref:AAA family ATPase n=1 Tax=Burkholderia anthina TaxID=179879 RepID=UPI00158B5D24|nr:MoxR family ATPase [Burkholderia anthina]